MGKRAAVWAKGLVEMVVFSSKWVLVPFYVGLMLALGAYALYFLRELWHVLTEWHSLTVDAMLLAMLELVDMAMIAGLVKMVISGSYTSFVDRTPTDTSERTSSGLLKVKMGTSLILVASIRILQTFLRAGEVKPLELGVQLTVLAVFVLAAMALAWIDSKHHVGHPGASHGEPGA